MFINYNMIIDGRGIDVQMVLVRLKEMLSSYCGMEVSIDILLGKHEDARKVRAFASMSGCTTDMEGKDGYYLLRIRGNVCCA